MVVLCRVVFVVLLVAVTALSLTPAPPSSEPGFALTRAIAAVLFGDEQYADKVAHFLAYLALAIAAAFADWTPRRPWAAALFLIIYGLAMEGGQHFIAVRTPDGADVAANSFGAVAGFALGRIASAILTRRAVNRGKAGRRSRASWRGCAAKRD